MQPEVGRNFAFEASLTQPLVSFLLVDFGYPFPVINVAMNRTVPVSSMSLSSESLNLKVVLGNHKLAMGTEVRLAFCGLFL